MNTKALLLTSIFLFFVSIICNAQEKRAIKVLEEQMISILQSDGILLTEEQKACMNKDCRPRSPWRNNSQRQKEINKDENLKTILLRNFLASAEQMLKDNHIKNNLIFRDNKLSRWVVI
ncbi:hypothetical protein BWI97_14410 [Siphonobacter sp. BAB-5405]|uniref:hypothetical protein n=1 Tax=Siphonobacter sp. BAB-5405 TaxID=1864825 RepID=UPI000C808354|nr:hypothetical protein [Siphonobacter sp. BAB-5405]PMD95545.1 hypothetical protein BWI97_14410 [Siphonobacter sp. BAB-5405]